jgi:hypothetical protein
MCPIRGFFHIKGALIMGAQATTNAGAKFYVCETTQPADLDATAYAALTWVLVGGTSAIPDAGAIEEIVSYERTDGAALKGKGSLDYGGGDLEVAYLPADLGQIALTTMAATKVPYAFKVVLDDAAGDLSATTQFMRGVVGRASRPGKNGKEFSTRVFPLGFEHFLEVLPA